jgi:hypothetical protein
MKEKIASSMFRGVAVNGSDIESKHAPISDAPCALGPVGPEAEIGQSEPYFS